MLRLYVDFEEIAIAYGLGVDMWAAVEVLELKAMFSDVRLVAVRLCESQASRWSAEHQHIYYDVILPKADDIVLLQNRYTSDCMARNRYLVDNAKNLLAVYDCGGRGGTAYTVEHAQAKERAITVIQPDTHQVFAPT